MSFQEISIDISRLPIEQQLRLLDMLTASLRAHWSATPETQPEIAPVRFDDSPLSDLIAVGKSGLGDVASNHDEYLYGARQVR